MLAGRFVNLNRMPEDGWEEQLCLSIPRMDREHRAMIEAATAFRTAVDRGAGRGALDGLLAVFCKRAADHFASEEELMQLSGYPVYETHRHEHERLLEQLRVLRSEFTDGKIDICGALSLFMNAWSRQHILGPDRHLSEFLHCYAPENAEAAVPGTGQLISSGRR